MLFWPGSNFTQLVIQMQCCTALCTLLHFYIDTDAVLHSLVYSVHRCIATDALLHCTPMQEFIKTDDGVANAMQAVICTCSYVSVSPGPQWFFQFLMLSYFQTIIPICSHRFVSTAQRCSSVWVFKWSNPSIHTPVELCVFLSISLMFQDVPRCSQMFPNVHRCSQMFKISTKFHNFHQISQFRPNFTISTKFHNFY